MKDEETKKFNSLTKVMQLMSGIARIPSPLAVFPKPAHFLLYRRAGQSGELNELLLCGLIYTKH